jgi:hypothetical protein
MFIPNFWIRKDERERHRFISLIENFLKEVSLLGYKPCNPLEVNGYLWILKMGATHSFELSVCCLSTDYTAL